MEACNNCLDPQWAGEELLTKYQYVADVFIALAYFSIPVELAYFVLKSTVFPYKGVLFLFGLFIVLCGTTHMISLWTVSMDHSIVVELVMSVAKLLTAVISCGTALKFVQVIPDLLSVKKRELFLKKKADELDREMGLMRNEAENGKHVRMLTKEIRNSLNKHTILNTTLVELSKTLCLEECCLWMPTKGGNELELFKSLPSKVSTVTPAITIHHPDIKLVFSTKNAIAIRSNSPIALITTTNLNQRPVKYSPGECAAVRVPFLHLNDFRAKQGHVLEENRSFALMVLRLPSNSARRWRQHELELVNAVADQVAVAMSHASILEDSIKARDLLMQQNLELEAAKREAEIADQARNEFMAMMNKEMRSPMSCIVSIMSRIQDTAVNSVQKGLVKVILENCNLLAKLVNGILDLSKKECAVSPLHIQTFSLRAIFDQVVNEVKPVALIKKIVLSLRVSHKVPDNVRGDNNKLIQILLNIVGNAVKFTKEGGVNITAELDNYSSNSEYIHLRVQVRDTGQGFVPQDIPKLFHANTSLAICKRFVNVMEGNIWIESEGPDKGSVVTFIVKLLKCENQDVRDYSDSEMEPLLGTKP